MLRKAQQSMDAALKPNRRSWFGGKNPGDKYIENPNETNAKEFITGLEKTRI